MSAQLTFGDVATPLRPPTRSIEGDVLVLTENDEIVVRWHERPDTYNLYLREKHGLPDAWEWFEISSELERVPEGFILFRGGIMTRNRKGRRTWPKAKSERQIFFAARADIDAWRRARADAAGECYECEGVGYTWKGTSWRDPDNVIYRFRACTHCNTTGRA